MKKKILTKFTCLCFIVCFFSNVNAQDAFIGYNYLTANYPLAWTHNASTFNAGTNKEIIFSTDGGSGNVKSATVANTSSITHYELGSNSFFIEVNLAASSVTSSFTIKLTGSSNSTTANACRGGVVYSDKIPFDPTSCIGAESTAFFPPSNGAWTEINLNPPTGAKSLRMYRRIFVGNGTMSTSSGSGRVEYGLGTTIRLASISAGVTPAGTLPLSLTSFKATTQSEGISLNWSTASESNTDKFVLERIAADGSALTVATIKAAGNSTKTIHYAAIDKRVTQGETYYYRLKMIDQDGSFTYSNVVDLKFGVLQTQNKLSVYPNPAKEKVTVNFHEDLRSGANLTLLNVSGNKISTHKLEPNMKKFDIAVNHLPTGAYIIQVDNSGEKQSAKFLKVN
jgi:hypothetical protein